MESDTVEFCEALSKKCNCVKDLLEEHLEDYDEILPHVFMADVARLILSGTHERQCLIEFLEQGMQDHREEVKNLIAVSFVEFFECDRDFEQAVNDTKAKALRMEWKRQKGV